MLSLFAEKTHLLILALISLLGLGRFDMYVPKYTTFSGVGSKVPSSYFVL